MYITSDCSKNKRTRVVLLMMSKSKKCGVKIRISLSESEQGGDICILNPGIPCRCFHLSEPIQDIQDHANSIQFHYQPLSNLCRACRGFLPSLGGLPLSDRPPFLRVAVTRSALSTLAVYAIHKVTTSFVV